MELLESPSNLNAAGLSLSFANAEAPSPTDANVAAPSPSYANGAARISIKSECCRAVADLTLFRSDYSAAALQMPCHYELQNKSGAPQYLK